MKSNLLKKKNDEVILKELAGTEYVIVSYIEGIDNKEEKKSLQDHITKYQKKFIDKEISYDQYLTEIYEPIRKDALSKYESATSRINELLPP
jgi:GTPase Era involved in 16S rRNA processing